MITEEEQIEINMQAVQEDMAAWAEKERVDREEQVKKYIAEIEREMGWVMIVTHKAFENENSGQQPYEAATVEYDSDKSLIENLEFAYRWTQNISDSWSKNMHHDGHERVTCLVELGEMGLRSTSMGDTVSIGDTVYVVAGFGFETIDGESVGEEE
jgi:hypothetical protein